MALSEKSSLLQAQREKQSKEFITRRQLPRENGVRIPPQECPCLWEHTFFYPEQYTWDTSHASYNQSTERCQILCTFSPTNFLCSTWVIRWWEHCMPQQPSPARAIKNKQNIHCHTDIIAGQQKDTQMGCLFCISAPITRKGGKTNTSKQRSWHFW